MVRFMAQSKHPLTTSSPSPIAFMPVATSSTRHDGWTAARQRGFIAHLAEVGVVAEAARAVGISARSAYRLRNRPDAASFRTAWDAALDMGQQRALDIAMTRAMHGYREPVFYRGIEVGFRQRHDNRLLLACLRAIDPDHVGVPPVPPFE